MGNCKVRFAPSPTGFMHIGNARIAIINYLFCQKNSGCFLLRIDDTDSVRSNIEYEESIMQNLKWLGINFDEKFKQSERFGRYHEIFHKLINSGLIYPCYETAEELEFKRKQVIACGKPPVYDRFALTLTHEEKQKLEQLGAAKYWRFKLPGKKIIWQDMIMKEISYDLRNVSDPVVMKSDGSFLYTFSSVVDDIDSDITHIIRGQDHVTNTAVQIAMAEEIAQNNIVFGHLSLLVDKDGAQFSKRLGSLNLNEIAEQGIDPMTINSFLATLGSANDMWPICCMQELADYFDITSFSKNSPKFDIKDLLKFNTKVVQKYSYEEVLSKIGINCCPSKEVFELVKDNIENLNDYTKWKVIFSHDFVSSQIASSQILSVACDGVEKIENWNYDFCQNFIAELQQQTKISRRDLYVSIRMALTGLEHGPNLVNIMLLLQKENVLKRLKQAYLEK